MTVASDRERPSTIGERPPGDAWPYYFLRVCLSAFVVVPIPGRHRQNM